MDERVNQQLKEVGDAVRKSNDKLYSIENLQREAANVQRGEITDLKRELSECAVAIGKHADEIQSFRQHEEKQNGTLEKIFGKLEAIGDMIHTLSNARTKEVNAIERQLTERIDSGLNKVNTRIEHDRQRVWYWIITAVGSIAFVFLTVILAMVTHSFGGMLP